MIAEKIITTTQKIDVDVIGITLLSAEEVKKVDKRTISVDESWWLRSPGSGDYYAMCVFDAGFIDGNGFDVYDELGVRPSLQISDLESFNLRIGDRFALAGEQWVVISKDKALCDRIIGKAPFRKNLKAPDANDYEKSDVKIWLENWALERGIIQEVNRNEISS